MSFDPPFRHRKRAAAPQSDLESKVARRGGKTGYSLLDDSSTNKSSSIGGFHNNNNDETSELGSVSAGIYGSRIVSSSSRLNRTRSFPTSAGSQTTTQTAPASRRSTTSQQSRFSRASVASSARHSSQHVPAVHIVCAISENRARETSVASMDAGAPGHLLVTKQGNGLAYAETIAYLETLQPHEILLNEGRRHSPLVRKILQAFNVSEHAVSEMIGSTPPRRRMNHEQEGDDESQYNDQENHRYGSLETDTTVKFLSRACFDQTRGAELLRRIAREETYDATVVQDYTLLSAAHAVLQYTQSCLGATFARNSLALSIQAGGPHRLRMDRHTVQQLELLVNSKTKKVAHSLVGSIDCTKTTVGSRLLRTNLMAPPVGIETIHTRLELVEVFLSDQDFFYVVMDHLSALPDVDKILSSLTLVPTVGNGKTVSPRMASRGISALVCIKATLSSLPTFANALHTKLQSLQERFGGNGGAVDDGATIRTDRSSLLVGLGGGSQNSRVERFHLLRAILFAMTQPSLSAVLQVVCEIFEERTTYSRNANAMRHTECFALKCEESDLMAVLRKAYLSNVDDIYKKADEYAEIHGLHVQVRYTTTRGYFLAVPAMAHDTLPDIFLQPSVSGRYITCTTEEISSLNIRVADNVHDLLIMTHDRIQQVLDVARSHYDALAALCDAIALLDMCHSFADVVTLSPAQMWCRPVVVKASSGQERSHAPPSDGSTAGDPRGALMIRKGRFAIDLSGTGLLSPESPNEYVPNDTYATLDKSFTIITGINGSGKSTYLKQIAMIVVLAQCGSYVPAEQAIIPVREQIFCRIGNTDDQEHNLSTFLLEMKETAFILNHATEKSLVLVDELGRATSNEDGVAIAWATAEYLLKKRAMTFFVTHYPQLTRLSDTYPRAVQNVHLAATVQPGSYGDIRYTFQLRNGACSVSSEYGIELAAACGWPQELVDDAFAIQQAVQEAMPDDRVCDTRPSEQDVFVADRAVTLIEETLQALKEIASQTGTLSSSEIRQQLCDLQDSVFASIRESGFEDQLWETMNSLFRDGQRLGATRAEMAGAMGGENVVHEPHVTADEIGCWPRDEQGLGVPGAEMSGATGILLAGGKNAVHEPNMNADGTSSLSSSDSSEDSESSDSDSSSSSSDGSA